jgi:hypothetical protein
MKTTALARVEPSARLGRSLSASECANAVTKQVPPIPAEVADINRSLSQLFTLIEQLEGSLQTVCSPTAVGAEDSKCPAPTPTGLHGDICTIHRGVRQAIDRVQALHSSLLV